MKFYFVYFSYHYNKYLPYQNGYSIVIADQINQAIDIFKKYHPNKNKNICAFFYYTEEEWSLGAGSEYNYPCSEILGFDIITNPEYVKLNMEKTYEEMEDNELTFCRNKEVEWYIPKINSLIKRGYSKGKIIGDIYDLYNCYYIYSTRDLFNGLSWYSVELEDLLLKETLNELDAIRYGKTNPLTEI